MGVVDKLEQAVRDGALVLSRPATPPVFASESLRAIRLHADEDTFTIMVDDEYGDVERGSPALLLNLVLMACTTYEDEDDVLAWSRAHGLDVANEQVRTYHMSLRAVVPGLRAVVRGVPHVGFLEWQLNSGEAQRLRRSGVDPTTSPA